MNSKTHLASTRARLLAGSLLAGLAFAPGVVAAAEDASVEEVVITGSRLLRPNLDSQTSVIAVDTQTIERSGSVNTGDILRILPVAGVSTYTPTNSTFNTSSAGVTTVDLRNLGEDRTLVMVNGRRYVAGIPGTQVVDFNSIPTDFVDRIDVITGGASAVYGSDALAGVINIITKKDIDGITFNAQYGLSERGDDERIKYSATAGSQFADEKGYAALNLTFSKIGDINARDRGDRGMAIDSVIPSAAEYQQQISGGFSSYSEFGRIDVASYDFTLDDDGAEMGAANNPYVVLSNGTVVDYSSSEHGFNRQSKRILQTPIEQFQVSGIFEFDLADSHKMFSEFNYSRGTISSTFEAAPLDSADIYGTDAFCDYYDDDPDTSGKEGSVTCRNGVSLTSAIVPTALKDLVRSQNPTLADEDLVVGFRRRLTEVALRGNDADRQTMRFVVGFTGELSPVIDYEFSLNYGRTDDDQTSAGEVNTERFANALDTVILDGKMVCASATARAAGCSPIDVFGLGKISPAAAKYVAITTSQDSAIEQFVLNGYLRGQGLELPAGNLSWVAGAEYRKESSRATPDALTQSGLASGNAIPETSGSFDVYEFFGELRIPLLADSPLGKSLDLNLASRVSQYSTVGWTSAYAASLEYRPTDSFKFRTQYAVAVRAPNISELYQPASQDFPSVTDPCGGVTRSGGQAAFFNTRINTAEPGSVPDSGIDTSTIGSALATACLQDPAVLSRVNRDGWFELTQSEEQGTSGFDSGNPNLDPEKGKTLSFGVVFEPAWGGIWDSLSASIDYYRIEITDRIYNLPEDTLLNGCYGSGNYSAGGQFCAPIQRFSTGPNVGSLEFVNQFSDNFAETVAEGVDVQINYAFDLADLPMFEKDWGSLALGVSYNFVNDLTTIPYPGASASETVVDKGTVGAPEHKATFSALYELGKLQVSWNTQYIGESVIETNPTSSYNGVVVDAAAFSSAQVNFDLGERASIYAGVDNIFDKYVFQGHTNGIVPGTPTGWTTWPDVYDGVGRRGYAGIRVKF